MIAPKIINYLEPGEIFVFGSNQAGRHGKGAAKLAYDKFGAIWGVGVGLMDSCYAIPTKNYDLDPLPLPEIAPYVHYFIKEAVLRNDLVFLVTEIGCGLAGYKPSQIGPMFKWSPKNVWLPESFIPFV